VTNAATLRSDPLEHGEIHVVETGKKRSVPPKRLSIRLQDHNLRVGDHSEKRAEFGKFCADVHFRASGPLSEPASLPLRPTLLGLVARLFEGPIPGWPGKGAHAAKSRPKQVFPQASVMAKPARKFFPNRKIR
jgi:hypothetical protein